MKHLTELILVFLVSSVAATAQTPPGTPAQGMVEKVEIAGIDDQRLSRDLRDSIQKLTGERYDPAGGLQLANRIQSEIPGVVAAPRVLPGADAAHVRVVFVVAQSSLAPAGPESNVNSQYVVEAVEVKGLERSQYSNAIYEEMQRMVGQQLDNNLVEDLRVRLSAEVRKEYFINQKIERGSMPQHVKVVFQAERTPWLFRVTLGRVINGNVGNGHLEIGTPNREKDMVEAVEVKGISRLRISDALYEELQMMVGKQVDQLEIDHLLEKLKAELKEDYAVSKHLDGGSKAYQTRVRYQVELIPWLPYRAPQSNVAYHQKQGITFVCCGDDFISKYTTLNLAFDGDSLTERYKGLSFGVESRQLGSRHWGARLGFDTFGVQWKDQTRRAIAGTSAVPGLYRSREGVTPSIAYAFDRHLFVTAGANLVEIEREGPTSFWQSVHEGVASIHYDSQQMKRGLSSYQTIADYEVRTGARNIGSSYSFTRHAFQARSTAKAGKNSLTLSFMGGRITGNAPLFERFSLGNTQTLRGWNKYDIDPLGGNRVWHSTAEYRFSSLGIFLDQGAVWDDGSGGKTRRSVGLTLGTTVGIAMPLDCAGHCGVTFFANFR